MDENKDNKQNYIMCHCAYIKQRVHPHRSSQTHHKTHLLHALELDSISLAVNTVM